MTDYKELVNELRTTERICRDRMDGQVMIEAADAIEALQAKVERLTKENKELIEDRPEMEEVNGHWEWRKPNGEVLMPKRDEWISVHEVAGLLAEMFGDDCACNINCIDEWLPDYCEFESKCPEPGGVVCWEQYLKHREHRPNVEVQDGND